MNARPLFALGLSLVVSIVLLLVVILPAEFDIDPLGTGTALNLLGMSDERPAQGYFRQEKGFRTHDVAFELAPFESVEIKYRLEQSASIMFSWSASNEIVWDLHAEPDTGSKGYAESFGTGRAADSYGNYVATFTGVHGWFFENRRAESVSVRLTTVGFFAEGVIYRGGYPGNFDVPAYESKSDML